MAAPAANAMKYRYLGNSGLLVSTLSFGSWMGFGQPLPDFDTAYAIMEHAFKHGINFFDNAEIYGNGESEVLMGKIIQRGIENGVWTREDLTWSQDLERKAGLAAKLADVAKEVGATVAQLSIAWAAANKNVSTVILGATSVAQLDENLKALAFVDKITPEIRAKVDAIVPFVPKVVPRAEPIVYSMRKSHL
ncbi:hypothetical protein PybrP1_012171 [[Pythium] brassicae (nom. inval.)]|nr:hypothetical protein PybrP1_012171 [[Pythium] brassicae (nom. inval.)]